MLVDFLEVLCTGEEKMWCCLTLNGMGSEKSSRYGGATPASLFPLFKGQLKQNLGLCSLFWDQGPSFDQLFYF